MRQPDGFVHISPRSLPAHTLQAPLPPPCQGQSWGTFGSEADVAQDEGLLVCFVFSWRLLWGLGREKDGRFQLLWTPELIASIMGSIKLPFPGERCCQC